MSESSKKSPGSELTDKKSVGRKSTGRIVLKLSVKDLKHEWILTLCLVMAISAVLSPLLLLFGLKYGIIEWGRDYLTQDPRYREVRPLTSKSFTKQWFEKMEEKEIVDFIIPMTRQISATAKANVKGKKATEELNIIPTRENDPLILENGALIPGPGECVLTQFAAEALKAVTGDILEIKTSRIKKSRYEFGTMELKVKGIVSVRASELKSMYVQLNILEAVEKFKDGQAVHEFGWKGSTPAAYPLYDGIIIVLDKKLSKVGEFNLCNRTGFTKIESLNNKELITKAGFGVSSEKSIYRLYTMRKPAGEDSLNNVKNKLRGKNASLFPWVAPVTAKLLDSSGKEICDINLSGLSAASEKSEEIGLSPLPEWGKEQSETTQKLKIMLPAGISVQDKIFIKISKDGESMTFPVQVMEKRIAKDSKTAIIPNELAGILRLYQLRNIRFDDKINEFVLFRRGYAGFRLYTKSIFAVDELRRFFGEQSIPVHTEIKEIKKVIELDNGMTLIFWLLAIVGIAGSVASLVASLYASVERKKRELSVLRLIGLSGARLFRFPVYQGIIIAGGGFMVSMIIFSIFARLINNMFRPYIDKLLGFPMEAGVSFCRLPFFHISGVLLATVMIAAVAAMIAAVRVTRIEPAEALRDE